MRRGELHEALKRRRAAVLFILLTLAGVGRIALTYHPISQTSDEAPNIACGMEWLDKGRYDYGRFHPPLARAAMSIGPYLYGARSQGLPDRWREGNAVLNSARRPATALMLARAGILPFFILAAGCVWLWSRRLLGEWGALASVFLFTNLPPVLAHAGLATSDMAVAAGVTAAAFAMAAWLERPGWRQGAFLGCGVAVAALSKFSSVLMLPACALAFVILRAMRPAVEADGEVRPATRWKSLAAALLLAFALVWSAYRFSWGPMSEHVVADAAGQGGIWPKAPANLLRLLETTPLPAPEILDGLWEVHNHAEAGHAAYLLGSNKSSGWWYFFPVAIAVKTPLGFLLLAAAGIYALVRFKSDWRPWAPAAGAAAILVACLPATLNIGVRYMLPLYPMLAIVAGGGAVWLFRRRGAWRALAVLLMLWTAGSSLAAHPDYIAYFNEIGGSRPERILVDSDLDWGQDMGLLVRELKRRHVPSLHMRCLYTGDDARLDLPPWDDLQPYTPVTGWVAVSFTMLKTNGWAVARQQGRSDNAFGWLDRYRPVARVGKSILLYYIPERRG